MIQRKNESLVATADGDLINEIGYIAGCIAIVVATAKIGVVGLVDIVYE